MSHSMWKTLELNNNRLGSVGAASISKGLAHNTSLKQLALQVRTDHSSMPIAVIELSAYFFTIAHGSSRTTTLTPGAPMT